MKRLDRRLTYIVLLLGTLLMIFPFYWMVTTSFKTVAESVRFPPTLIPLDWTLESYTRIFQTLPFARFAWNSIVMAVGVTLCVLLTSSLAGYAFARMEFSFKTILFTLVLATLMVPGEVTIIPNFVLMNNLRWINTYQALILPMGANVFSIFLMRQAFLSIPVDLYDAALLDGATHIQYLRDVALPLAKSSLAVVGLLAFLRSWNAMLWPLIATTTKDMRTLQVGLTMLTQDTNMEYPILMAAATFTVVPILVLYLLTQRQFIEGISTTGMQ